jgi:hypothetical protein
MHVAATTPLSTSRISAFRRANVASKMRCRKNKTPKPQERPGSFLRQRSLLLLFYIAAKHEADFGHSPELIVA